MYALSGGPPFRPALVKTGEGEAIEVEVWRMPLVHVGSFLQGIGAPLGLGTVCLADGSSVKGFICEAGNSLEGAQDITQHLGWRAYVASLNGTPGVGTSTAAPGPTNPEIHA